jgi:membrane protein DedA with SNARE-associated domain
MEQLLGQNGYLTVFVAVVFGGELGLFAGAAFARAGNVSLGGVVILGTAASFIVNTLYYYAGKLLWKRWHYLRRKFGEKVESTSGAVRRFGPVSMLVARFFYGARDIVPITLGIYGVSAGSFAIYNIVGAFVWALAFVLFGFYFSELFESSFHSFRAGIIWGMVAAVAIVVSYALIRKAIGKNRGKTEAGRVK